MHGDDANFSVLSHIITSLSGRYVRRDNFPLISVSMFVVQLYLSVSATYLIGIHISCLPFFYSYENQLRQNTPEVEDIEIACATLKSTILTVTKKTLGKKSRTKKK